MAPQASPYYERIDDESLLNRPGSGPDDHHGYEAHALGPIRRGGGDSRDEFGYNASIHAA